MEFASEGFARFFAVLTSGPSTKQKIAPLPLAA